MSEPLRFACAVPVGGWHPFLPAALESLAAQDAPLEVALLNASGDARVDAAADASGIDFAYRRSGPDKGQAAAIAEGWRATGGEIVFWVNADDRLLPGALKCVTEVFNRPSRPNVVFGGSDFIDADETRTGRHDKLADASDLLFRSNTVSQPSCFAQRAAVERVGGLDETLHYVMDWDLWVRLYLAGERFEQVEAQLSAVYMGAGTKTELLSVKRLREVFTLVRRNAGAWAAMKSTFSLGAATLSRRRRAPWPDHQSIFRK